MVGARIPTNDTMERASSDFHGDKTNSACASQHSSKNTLEVLGCRRHGKTLQESDPNRQRRLWRYFCCDRNSLFHSRSSSVATAGGGAPINVDLPR
jgi:hypothetical protein